MLLLPLLMLAAALMETPSASWAAERMVAEDLNAHREAASISPLRIDGQLTALARERAVDMVRRRYFDHTNPEGETAFDVLRSRAYRFTYAAENISLASDEEQAEQGLWDSLPHRRNMLGAYYRRVGIAVIQTATECYVVQLFSD
jgi:uncharacterized protein YkwD